jgi:hypothetical protein
MRFIYHGRDILEITSRDGIAEDWSHVCAAISHNFAMGLPAAPHITESEEEDAIARR